ncbi:alanine--tRNA ligase, partial [Candidatus Erwinia dacicola]|nr:alanine--tRNA ligase [Candidatus Erwinia dacicola]
MQRIALQVFQLFVQQRQRARSASGFETDYNNVIRIDQTSAFKGYEELALNATVTAIFVDGQAADEINTGQKGVIVLDETPFYGESGGQVGDTGELKTSDASF